MVILFIAAHPIDAYRVWTITLLHLRKAETACPTFHSKGTEVRTVDLSGAIRKVRTFAPSRVGKGAGNKKQK